MPTEAPGGPERTQLYQQMQALHEKIEKATKEGKQDEVQRLKQEAEALPTKLYAQGAPAPSRPQSGGDRDARLQHLRAAAENLKAAGCEPEAQHVMQMISRIQGEGSGPGRPQGESTRARPDGRQGSGSSTRPGESPPNPRGSGSSTRPGGSPPNPRDYGNSPAVQELRDQVEQMSRELREIREQLNRARAASGNKVRGQK